MTSEHRPFLFLASAALAVVALLCLAGCKTPPPAPVYGAATVAPPATGMMGQPAPYGTPPQAVSYAPQAGSPMPGPATSWQGVPQASTTPPANTWNWSQAGSPTPQAAQPPQQPYAYGNQMQPQANQFANQPPQTMANQQQVPNQIQNQPNQYQQGVNNQVPQYGNQMQQGMQNAPQQLNNQMQQAMPQMPSAPQTQTVNGNWWPFSDPNALPPARATPTGISRY